MKTNIVKTYVTPIVTGVIFLLLTGYWAYNEKNTFREQTITIINKQADVLIESIKSIILTQMREGRMDKMGLEFILSNIVYGTSLKYISLKKDDSTLFEIGSIPEGVFTEKDQGSLFYGDIFYYWKTIKFVRLPPPPPDMLRRMQFKIVREGDGRNDMPPPPDAFFDFRESSQKLVIGLNFAVFQKQIQEEDYKLAVICIIMLFTIFILIFTWIHFVKNSIIKLELEKATGRNEKLEEMNFASTGLAHEVKNPLGLIRGFAQKISQNTDNIELIHNLSEHIIDECDITTERISDFINYAKRRPLNEQVIDAKKDVGDIINMLKYEFDDRMIILIYELDNVKFIADREFLQQIIVNVLMNSIQACKAGNKVVLKLKKKQNSAILTISDNGPGIDDMLMSQIYKPYVSGRNDGHGIGLAIVKKLVEEHGWYISMSSKSGSGTETEISRIRLA